MHNRKTEEIHHGGTEIELVLRIFESCPDKHIGELSGPKEESPALNTLLLELFSPCLRGDSLPLPTSSRGHCWKGRSPNGTLPSNCVSTTSKGEPLMPRLRCFIGLVLIAASFGIASATRKLIAAELRGEIRDAASGELLPARITIQSADGAKWFFAKSANANGSALSYDRVRGEKSIEKHTTLSAHPFVVEVPAGKYTLTTERGKEYLTVTQEIEVDEKPVSVTITLKRWINMAERGWYSGDTHMHRTLAEMPNLVLAEDLNMAFPMSQWVQASHTLPEKGTVDPKPIPTEPIFADATHAIMPLNSEYEIFSVGAKRHTLGAVLVLGQKSPMKVGAPPLKAVAEEAHKQGALLDLEKHSWAWTPIIAPVMKADLYPLTNNHIWRTEFAFKSWTIENNWRDNPRIETTKEGFTEEGWMNFGFETYYALLNCGLRMRPTAGTGNGVHSVSAGFGRVYVDLGKDKFTPDLWMKRLNEGHSFVTTGPMLMLKVGDKPLGSFKLSKSKRRLGLVELFPVSGQIISQFPLDRIEIINSDGVLRVIKPPTQSGEYFRYEFSEEFYYEDSIWFAVRCFEKLPNGRVRFAHSAPAFVDFEDSPIRPRRDQVRYLIQRCEEEISRNKEVLNEAELAEYREALEFYQSKLATAR